MHFPRLGMWDGQVDLHRGVVCGHLLWLLVLRGRWGFVLRQRYLLGGL